MSEVISFRLNKNNLREAKALLVIQECRAKGYSLRQIITDALIKHDEAWSDPPTPNIDELNNKFNQLLEQLSNGDPRRITQPNTSIGQSELADQFIASIKKTAKQGIKIR
ncbi:MAG: hypothetical protein JW908_09090 [Anaerolineales bacterium]|nr:hypothetical protein [Anaerolineales bacterium]